MGLMRISVPGAEDDSPRKDRKNFTWFKFQNKFFGEQSTFLMSESQIVLFLYLKCEASKHGSATVEILPEFVSAILRKAESEIISDIERLSELRLIAVVTPSSCNLNGRAREEKRREEERREESREEPPQAEVEPALPFKAEPEVEVTPEERIYDKDHESVAVKPKPDELPRLAQLWNEKTTEPLSKVLRCSPPRRKKALAKWKEEPREEFWANVFAKINGSQFLCGMIQPKDGRKPFKADFDWLLEGSNVDKILEGKYDGGRANASDKPSYFARKFQEEPK